MHFFNDYIQPLTDWLQVNPHWSLFITFFISLLESLAIIGSIVPGSITMTAIGILAGSGIMRVDLTLLAATLGAICGDSLSYALGYYYSDRLIEIWPFSKYPKMLQYGKDFFALHGGKSVLIGRFVGPLRSIIPVIAGILHMKQWRFLLANVLSAIGWSLLYVMPGVIIGAASQELPTKSATRMLLLILLILGCIWILKLIIKKIIRVGHSFLNRHLNHLWLYFKNNFLLVHVYNLFTPKYEKNHYATASLVLLTLTGIIIWITLVILVAKTHWLNPINIPTHLLMQSFNYKTLKVFFIFCSQLTSTLSIFIFFISCCFWLIYRKEFSTIIYLFSILIFSSFLAFILNHFIYIARPTGLMVVMQGSSFPAVNLQIATALYSFISFYMSNTYFLFSNLIKSIIFGILGLSGLGLLYLGDYWLTDICASYLAGGLISLIHCLLFRKLNHKRKRTSYLIFKIYPLLIGLILASLLSTYLNYASLNFNHRPYHNVFILNEKTWWHQKKPFLPLYQVSRLGKQVSVLNLQFVGDLDLLESILIENGWILQSNSFFKNLLIRMSNQKNTIKLPIFTQLYKNKAPILTMTYTNKLSSTFELRIWESNYHFSKWNKPLWLGSIHSSGTQTTIKSDQRNFSDFINPINYLMNNKEYFKYKKILLDVSAIKPTYYDTTPYLILIKQKNLSP